MNLVDIHCHLNHALFKEDLPLVLERAKKAGLKAIVISGPNIPSNREVLKLAEKYPDKIVELGCHPGYENEELRQKYRHWGDYNWQEELEILKNG